MAEKFSGRPRERGAVLVEYALVIAVLALVALAAISALQDRASEEYQETSADITEVAGVVVLPDPEVPPAATVSTSCSGASCQMSITSPPPGATITWTTDPPSGGGSGPTFSLVGLKKGDSFVVSANIQPGGQTLTKTVSCASGSGPITCTAG